MIRPRSNQDEIDPAEWLYDYDLAEEPIVISKGLIDLLLREDHYSDLIGLYTFYYYTAKWQRTNQVRAVTGYVAKALNWTEERVQKRKNSLRSLGLIEDIRTRTNGGKMGKNYIRVKFIWGKEAVNRLLNEPTISNSNHPPEIRGSGHHYPDLPGGGFNQGVVNPGINALSANRENALSANRENTMGVAKTATPGGPSGNGSGNASHKDLDGPLENASPQDSPGQLSPRQQAAAQRTKQANQHNGEYREATTKLWSHIKTITQASPGDQGERGKWNGQIQHFMTTKKITLQRILAAIEWLQQHHPDQYCPTVFNAHDFTSKFFKIEAQMKRPTAAANPHQGEVMGSGDCKFRTIHGRSGTYYALLPTEEDLEFLNRPADFVETNEPIEAT